MFVFLSKFLPLFAYPLGLACILLILSLILRKHIRARHILVIAALLLLWLGSNRWVSYALARSLEWQYLPQQNIPKTEAIVILGGGTEPALYPRPSVEVNAAGDRVLYGARLYKQGKAANILVSGGNITFLSDTTTTPASDMAELLRLTGIPESAILIQGNSENTHDDAVLSARMLKERGISRAILVTSAMHMPRSVELFQHEGIDVIPAPTDYTITAAGWDNLFHGDLAAQVINALPNTSSLGLTTNVLKEYIGILVYRLQGWM